MLNESSMNAKYDEMSERLLRLKQVAIDNGVILADQIPEESPELTDIVVDIMTIGGKTYYIHEGGCFSPFLECRLYKLEIVDGENSYFSVG